MPADELGGRVDHDVRAVLDGAQQIRRGEGIVDDQRDAVPVRAFGDGADIGHVTVGIAHRFGVQRLGVLPDGSLKIRGIVAVHKRRFDADFLKRMRKTGRRCRRR